MANDSSSALPEEGSMDRAWPATSAEIVGSGSAPAMTTPARACSTCSRAAEIPGFRARDISIAS
jgi:hypothetical protein